jgi:hypothetical protein
MVKKIVKKKKKKVTLRGQLSHVGCVVRAGVGLAPLTLETDIGVKL